MSHGMSLILRLFGLLLVMVLSVSAQGGGFGGPISGLVFDPGAGAIRPVLGVPGGAYLGSPVVSGLEWASVAPNGKLALGVADSRLYLFRRLADLSMSGTVLEEGCTPPARVAWSAGSNAAAAYWTETGRLQVWSALATETRLADPIDLTTVEGRVSALAVVDSGSVVLLGVSAEGTGGIYAVEPGEAPSLLLPVVGPGAIVLARNERDLFVTDLAGQQILELGDFRGAANLVPLAGPESGVSEPVGLGLSLDGRRLFAVDKADLSLSVFDLESRAPLARTSLEFVPEGLEPLSGSGLFILKSGSAGGDPFQVLDGALEPAVFFIPTGQVLAEEE